ncbi:MAG: tRNA pseudouridine(55) synthase TruB [Acidobacteriota bacterium]|nr:tRNA pseudouridine(55) synthase TruB [Acidobacteriota bacterium]
MIVARHEGMLLVDKPIGMTSHEVVGWTRRLLGMRRVGHAGTLDPLASGLLPVLLGPATRLVRFMHGYPKCYVGLIRLGVETPTDDAEAAPPHIELPPLPPQDVLEAARRRLTGSYLQQPPAFSAKKIGGVPAHRLARRGFAPTLAPTLVTVHRLRLAARGPGRLAFAARVSSGTYLRSLARDLGRLVGTGAYLESLRRTGIGPLRVREALTPTDDLDGARAAVRIVPPESIPLPLPTIRLDRHACSLFGAGHPVGAPSVTAEPGAFARILAEDGRLMGVAELRAEGGVQPRVVLQAAGPASEAVR